MRLSKNPLLIPQGDQLDLFDPDPDPLRPHPEKPTPVDLVVRLTRKDRERRVDALVELAWMRYHEALATHTADKKVVGTCGLVSGGNDSYTVNHIFRSVLTHLVHANTGTGIEATREHVRATAKDWGLPLIEVRPKPGQGYREMVLGQLMAKSRTTHELVQAWPGGFPGPAAHHVCYTRLKERGLEQVPHRFGISGSRTERVVYVAGRRRAESRRRSTIPHHEVKGVVAWASPLAVWHKADLRAYRLRYPEVPHNPVAQKLGMSGECGCGANGAPGERDRWFAEYPDDPWLAEVLELEALLAGRTDIPEHRKRWMWGAYYDDGEDRSEGGLLCGPDCGRDPLVDMMDPLFSLEQVS